MKRFLYPLLQATGVYLLCAVNCNLLAAPILGASASTAMATASGYDLDNTTNQTGLVPGPPLDAEHVLSNDGNSWLSDGVETGMITFDLGNTYDVTGFSFWNFIEEDGGIIGYGISSLSILSSTNGTDFTAVAGAPSAFAEQDAFFSDPPQQFSFATVTASHFRFDISSNHDASDNSVGFAEVLFDGVATSVVPEPSSLALLGIGAVGLLGYRQRRKRKPNAA